MQKITTAADLKSTIQQLEYKQAQEWPLLKDKFLTAYNSLKLINIIKSTFKDVIAAPDFKSNIANAAIGLTTGFAARKIFTWKTHNPLKKLLGVILEMTVAKNVANNAEGIKSMGNTLLNKIFNHRGNPEKV